MDNCVLDTNKVDTAVWDSETIVFTCINECKDAAEPTASGVGYMWSKAKIHIGIVKFHSGSTSTYNVFTTTHAYNDYPFVSKFGSNFMSIFYHIYDHTNTDDASLGLNVFEIVGMPICHDVVEQMIYIYS
jgi:hypothetical protein